MTFLKDIQEEKRKKDADNWVFLLFPNFLGSVVTMRDVTLAC